jgi:hypothetical protein
MTPRQEIALKRLRDANGCASAYWLACGTGLTTTQMSVTLRQLERKGLASPGSAKFRNVIRNHHWYPTEATFSYGMLRGSNEPADVAQSPLNSDPIDGGRFVNRSRRTC